MTEKTRIIQQANDLSFLPTPAIVQILSADQARSERDTLPEAGSMLCGGDPDWYQELPGLASRVGLKTDFPRIQPSAVTADPDKAPCRLWLNIPAGSNADPSGISARVEAGDQQSAMRAGALIIQMLTMLERGMRFASEPGASPQTGPSADASSQSSAETDTILYIEDQPTYQDRGLHLDVARNFFSADTVCGMLDNMALHSLNRFHWHLTDDQGWRIPILEYPQLCPENQEHYSEEDIQRVTAHAGKLGITVVPEIDLPGHVQAALAYMPELAFGELDGGQPQGPWEAHGINPWALNPLSEKTYEFLEIVLLRCSELFETSRIHLGGDECLGLNWQSIPECRSWAIEQGLPDFPMEFQDMQVWAEHPARRALFTVFMKRSIEIAARLGIQLDLWDDVLEAFKDQQLPEGIRLLCWHIDGIEKASHTGLPLVACPENWVYLDHHQTDLSDELGPSHFRPNTISLTRVLSYQPPADADGLQCCIWTEVIDSVKRLEYMAYPRVLALAELAWNGSVSQPTEFRDQVISFWADSYRDRGIQGNWDRTRWVSSDE
ncbi:family 20 glycosylhydrolase [Spirochaeta dissipatitropha]